MTADKRGASSLVFGVTPPADDRDMPICSKSRIGRCRSSGPQDPAGRENWPRGGRLLQWFYDSFVQNIATFAITRVVIHQIPRVPMNGRVACRAHA